MSPDHRFTYGGFHGLRQNIDLGEAEYHHAKGIIGEVNVLVHEWIRYVGEQRLDPDIFHAQNAWAEIFSMAAPPSVPYPDDYRSVNFVRLLSPFTGFHLPWLDRLDGFRRFHDDHPALEAAKTLICSGVIPENLADIMEACLDPYQRLEHVIESYLRLISDLPSRYVVRTPARGGEVGLLINGNIVNPDVLICQARMRTLYSAGVLDVLEKKLRDGGPCRILEIGAGYGALAAALHALFPGKIEYIIIELPQVLWNTAAYMTAVDSAGIEILMPSDAFPSVFRTLLVANYLVEECRGHLGPVDLAINTMSLIEMSEAQVRYYAALMRDTLRDDGVCFVEGTPSKPYHVDCAEILSEIFPHHRHATNERIIAEQSACGIWSKTRGRGRH